MRFNPLKPNSAPLTKPRSAKPAPTAVTGAFGITLNPNEDGSGLQLRFPKRPAEDTLTALKSAGWRWSRLRMCWYHRNTAENAAFAERFLKADPAAPPAVTPEPAVPDNIIPVAFPSAAPVPVPAVTSPPMPSWRTRLLRTAP